MARGIGDSNAEPAPPRAKLGTMTILGGTIGAFSIAGSELHVDLTGGMALLTLEGFELEGFKRVGTRVAPGVGLSGHVAYGFRVSQLLRIDFGVRMTGASTSSDGHSSGVLSYAFLVDGLHF